LLVVCFVSLATLRQGRLNCLSFVSPYQEDKIIVDCMNSGTKKWSSIADKIEGRIGKQCRERWSNHLDPSLKKGDWTLEEDIALINAQAMVRVVLPY
jgi:hypothetical protein